MPIYEYRCQECDARAGIKALTGSPPEGPVPRSRMRQLRFCSPVLKFPPMIPAISIIVCGPEGKSGR